MSQPVRILNNATEGMKRDVSRDNLPQEAVWNLQDYFPEILGAPWRKRGGYTYASNDIAATTASASYIIAGIYAPFSAADKNVVFDEDGRGYFIAANGTVTDLGAVLPTVNPVFYNDLVIVPQWVGAAAPKKITSAPAVANLGGSPPNGRYAVVYKDVLWLASSSASADRIWFSTAGNPEDTWDTTNKYLDASYPITGMAALNNAVFVFSLSRTMRVRGSVPPPDSDFIVDDPIYDVGCTDNRSIAHYRDKVIWANAQGLYISDGTAMDDLTAICGMKNWWMDVMSGRDGFATGSEYAPSTWAIVGGIHRDSYVYCVLNGSTKVDAGAIDLKRYTWTRLKNIDAVSMWRRPYPDELYFGRRNAARVGALSGLWVPTSATSADADGTAVLPVVETGYIGGQDGALKTMRAVYLMADIRDPGSANPYLTLSYIDSPEETSYTDLIPTFTETTAISKVACVINEPARGIAFKIAQTGASSDTRLYGLDLYANAREGHR